MRKGIKFLIAIVTFMVTLTAINIKAAVGYTYDHRGDPIYSTVGFTINQKPYTAQDLGIAFDDFTNPRDIFTFTDSEGNKTIYVVDANSNKLFVFDDNFKLLKTVSSFTLKPSKFTDDQLKEYKSGGQYLIARDVLFSIPHEMEFINLVYDNEEFEDLSEQEITYQLGDIDFDYEIKWSSTNDSIADIEIRDGKPFIVAKGLGRVTINGGLYEAIEQNEEDDEEKEVAPIVTVKIQVTVTNEPEPPVIEEQHYGFTLADLRSKESIQLHANGLYGVYRAVTPTTREDLIYLADRNNNQVIVIDSETYEVVRIVRTPKDEYTFEGRDITPIDIVTDRAGRIYVIASNVNEGIMQFSREGEFNRFTGVNYVTLTPWEVFWRNFSTEEQLKKQQSIINTSFTSMAVDKEGFIYATSQALTNDRNIVTDDNNMIKRINPTGKDILRRNGYQPPKGDVKYHIGQVLALYNGPSKFAGITVNEYGVYTVVDGKMGRLFTYDNEGNLLYVSGNSRYSDGNIGNTQLTVLSNPVSLAYVHENVAVLDNSTKSIVLYELSDIGKLINRAVELEYQGNLNEAALYWQEVVKQNANYEYGYIGIGRMYFNNKDYKKAMEYFKFGYDRELYSRAYKLHRNVAIRKYFTPVAITLIVVFGGLSIYKKVKYRHLPKEEETGMGDE
ncbi:MAG TPA: hypothetical protein GXZ48_00775 [Acholeplasmataceae bacterium]|jgi:hypothetical protein|nr:hypothetical protein [Acholeplasmataceae bacterium]